MKVEFHFRRSADAFYSALDTSFFIGGTMPGTTKTNLKTIAIAMAAALALSACGTAQLNMIQVQTATAKTLGLASSDEITISNVQYEKVNSIGGQNFSYDATTVRGRRFTCTGFIVAGLTPLDKPKLSREECHPA
jgi:hypothetical protein